jgi:arsenate reductase (thioredoxin)
MQKLLFLCTGNSCRSQMAEGFAKALKNEKYKFYSAGTKKHGLNPRAVQVMEEVGIDISKHHSKTTDDLKNEKMDFIITVCSDADENCPYFPGGKIIHVGFDDPPTLTKTMTDEEAILCVYRRVRDEIKAMVENLEMHLEQK